MMHAYERWTWLRGFTSYAIIANVFHLPETYHWKYFGLWKSFPRVIKVTLYNLTTIMTMENANKGQSRVLLRFARVIAQQSCRCHTRFMLVILLTASPLWVAGKMIVLSCNVLRRVVTCGTILKPVYTERDHEGEHDHCDFPRDFLLESLHKPPLLQNAVIRAVTVALCAPMHHLSKMAASASHTDSYGILPLHTEEEKEEEIQAYICTTGALQTQIRYA